MTGENRSNRFRYEIENDFFQFENGKNSLFQRIIRYEHISATL